jgi:putative transposase
VDNAYIESFNGRLGDECLNTKIFVSLADARQKIEAWRRDCNANRPLSALGNLSPIDYTKKLGENRNYDAAAV